MVPTRLVLRPSGSECDRVAVNHSLNPDIALGRRYLFASRKTDWARAPKSGAAFSLWHPPPNPGSPAKMVGTPRLELGTSCV